jgi:hypothetical protein
MPISHRPGGDVTVADAPISSRRSRLLVVDDDRETWSLSGACCVSCTTPVAHGLR